MMSNFIKFLESDLCKFLKYSACFFIFYAHLEIKKSRFRAIAFDNWIFLKKKNNWYIWSSNMLFDSCGVIYDHSPLQFKLHFSDIWLHFRRYICEILQLINIKVTEGAFGKFEQKLENHKSKKLMTLFYVGKLTHAFFIREKIILFLLY